MRTPTPTEKQKVKSPSVMIWPERIGNFRYQTMGLEGRTAYSLKPNPDLTLAPSKRFRNSSMPGLKLWPAPGHNCFSHSRHVHGEGCCLDGGNLRRRREKVRVSVNASRNSSRAMLSASRMNSRSIASAAIRAANLPDAFRRCPAQGNRLGNPRQLCSGSFTSFRACSRGMAGISSWM
jgi:hypothetical protein